MVIEALVMLGAPLVLGGLVLERYPLRGGVVAAGAACFVASQLVHLPLNWLLQPLLPDPSGGPLALTLVCAFLGLSAGLCEELARYALLRWLRRGDRTGAHALALGLGHGGVESMILGLFVVQAILNVVVIERTGLDQLGLDATERGAVEAQLAAMRALGPVGPLLGAAERLFTIPFHVAASTLVMRAVVSERPAFVLAAIALHAALDGLAVAVGATLGPLTAELFLLLTVPVSLLVIARSLAALPALPVRGSGAHPSASGAPIELVRAEKRFGEVRALDGVDLVVREGQHVCLLGPNGAGKTTAMRLLSGALAPSAGFALLYGAGSGEAGFLDAKRRVGIVPQQPGMYGETTVRQYLDLVRALYRCGHDGRADADEGVVAALGLSEVLDRPMSALSGGTQRRLTLAAALLPRPDLLVLDEPSAGLDPVAARQMIDCVRDARRGRTMLLCTHNLHEAEALCEGVIILRDGRVLVQGSIAELRAHLERRIVLRAREGVARLREVLRELGHEAEDQGEALSVRLPELEAAAPTLLRALLAAGLEVFECRVVEPSLEEIFFRHLSAPAAARDAGPAAKEGMA
jgi:ABC-2 type transport system ATP-binding protein